MLPVLFILSEIFKDYHRWTPMNTDKRYDKILIFVIWFETKFFATELFLCALSLFFKKYFLLIKKVLLFF